MLRHAITHFLLIVQHKCFETFISYCHQDQTVPSSAREVLHDTLKERIQHTKEILCYIQVFVKMPYVRRTAGFWLRGTGIERKPF